MLRNDPIADASLPAMSALRALVTHVTYPPASTPTISASLLMRASPHPSSCAMLASSVGRL